MTKTNQTMIVSLPIENNLLPLPYKSSCSSIAIPVYIIVPFCTLDGEDVGAKSNCLKEDSYIVAD